MHGGGRDSLFSSAAEDAHELDAADGDAGGVEKRDEPYTAGDKAFTKEERDKKESKARGSGSGEGSGSVERDGHEREVEGTSEDHGESGEDDPGNIVLAETPIGNGEDGGDGSADEEGHRYADSLGAECDEAGIAAGVADEARTDEVDAERGDHHQDLIDAGGNAQVSILTIGEDANEPAIDGESQQVVEAVRSEVAKEAGPHRADGSDAGLVKGYGFLHRDFARGWAGRGAHFMYASGCPLRSGDRGA